MQTDKTWINMLLDIIWLTFVLNPNNFNLNRLIYWCFFYFCDFSGECTISAEWLAMALHASNIANYTANERLANQKKYRVCYLLFCVELTCWMCKHAQNIFVHSAHKTQRSCISCSCMSKHIINVNVMKTLNMNRHRVNCSYQSKTRTSNDSFHSYSMMISKKKKRDEL